MQTEQLKTILPQVPAPFQEAYKELHAGTVLSPKGKNDPMEVGHTPKSWSIVVTPSDRITYFTGERQAEKGSILIRLLPATLGGLYHRNIQTYLAHGFNASVNPGGLPGRIEISKKTATGKNRSLGLNLERPLGANQTSEGSDSFQYILPQVSQGLLTGALLLPHQLMRRSGWKGLLIVDDTLNDTRTSPVRHMEVLGIPARLLLTRRNTMDSVPLNRDTWYGLKYFIRPTIVPIDGETLVNPFKRSIFGPVVDGLSPVFVHLRDQRRQQT